MGKTARGIGHRAKMTTVTAEIKRILKAKDAKMMDGQAAIRGLMADVREQIVAELAAIRGETYTAAMLKAILTSIEKYLSAFESSASTDIKKLLDAAWEDGADMVPEVMRAGGMTVAFGHIPGTILSTFKDFTVTKISGVAGDAFNKIRGELSLGILGQKTPHQVIQGIAGSLDKPGIFKSLEARAETITKVEMGRAYSAATVDGLTQAQRSVPEMQKEWWHAGHPKMPRLSHLRLHGQRKPVDEPFHTGGLIIDYPRAPDQPAQEVINCACEVVPWHPKWGKTEAMGDGREAMGNGRMAAGHG